MPDLDACLDRLDAALAAAGLGALPRAEGTSVLTEIDAALEPWRLSEDVRRFWELIEVVHDEFPVVSWRMPSFDPPAVALATYRQNLEPSRARVRLGSSPPGSL